MKAIIPVAGIGTRLRPITNSVPKILVEVAGKAMLGHILDHLNKSGINQVVLIVGYLKERVFEYIDKYYAHMSIEFAEQKEMLGLGHAIFSARDFFQNDEILIVLGDTIYDVNLNDFTSTKHNALGLKAVEDPRRFGVAETDSAKKFVTKLVEKPDQPKSNLAVVGLYYIKHSQKLLNHLEYLITNNIRTKNEFQLTDALQMYLENDELMDAYQIGGWHDCGVFETLLDTNQLLLGREKEHEEKWHLQSKIIEPCHIHESVIIENSVIGPFVSINEGTVISGSIIKNCIIGSNNKLIDSHLEDSVIGNSCKIVNYKGNTYLGDFSALNS